MCAHANDRAGSLRRVKARTGSEGGARPTREAATESSGAAAHHTQWKGDTSGEDARAGAICCGSTVAIYCAAHRRFLRFDALGGMRAARPVKEPVLPREWEWERFVVVDGGGGLIALFCSAQQRFARMDKQDT